LVGKINIAVCTRRELKPEWVLCFGNVLGQAFMLAGVENVRWNINTAFPLDLARNQCVKEALAWDADYILFFDDDVLPPNDGLVKLVMDALPIVSGLYFDRRPPYTPLIARRKNRGKPWSLGEKVEWDIEFARNYPRNQLVEVDATGLGFMLVRREVFEEIAEPWFVIQPNYGEDFSFCWKAQQAGFKIYVDTNVKCLHMADLFVGEENVVREFFRKTWRVQPSFRDENVGVK
jgi:GT2 family glycosyltransferase